jgi:uncharacterized protein (DUF952 family)
VTEGAILHLMPIDAWRRWSAGGSYEPVSLATEGFVHCTGDDELMLDVANRFYAESPDELVVVSFDPDRLTSEVRWEAPAHPDGRPAGDDEPRFPHVYGPLQIEAATGVRRVRRLDGRFVGYAPID